MKRYKVLNAMRSLYANGHLTVVTYVPNEWVEPQEWAKKRDLGLWVYVDRKMALKCADDYTSGEASIWECEVEDPVQTKMADLFIPFHRISPDSPISIVDRKKYEECYMRVKVTKCLR